MHNVSTERGTLYGGIKRSHPCMQSDIETSIALVIAMSKISHETTLHLILKYTYANTVCTYPCKNGVLLMLHVDNISHFLTQLLPSD